MFRDEEEITIVTIGGQERQRQLQKEKKEI